MNMNRKNGQISRAASLDNSMEEHQHMTTLPILSQMTNLNQQSIKVRRPSDISVPLSQRIIESSAGSFQNVQKSTKSPNCQTEENLLVKPQLQLKFINEEASQKEQSLHVKSVSESMGKKSAMLFNHSQDILDQEVQNQECKNLLHTSNNSNKSIQWNRLYSNSHQPQSQANTQEIKVLNDKAVVNESISKKDVWNMAIGLMDAMYICYYCYSITVIIISVASFNYKYIYKQEIQLPMLINIMINTGISIYQSYSHCKLYRLVCIIPYIVYLLDSNQSMIILQLLYILDCYAMYKLFRFYDIYFTLYCYYQVYFIIRKLIEIHLIQLACMFILITQDNNNNTDITTLLSKYGIFNMLIMDGTLLHYLIKLFLTLYIAQLISCVTMTYSILCQEDNIKLKQLLTTSNSLCAVPQQLKKQLLAEEKQLMKQRFSRHLTDYSMCDNSKLELQDHLYKQVIKSIPILANSLSDETLKRVYSIIKERIYTPNEIIYQPNQELSSLIYLLEGDVQIYQINGMNRFDIQQTNKPQMFNQAGFFMNTYTDVGLMSIGYTKLIEIPLEQFLNILYLSPMDHQKFKMLQDQLLYERDFRSVGLNCYACSGSHPIDQCSRVHYVAPRKGLIDYIHVNYFNEREQTVRNRHRSKSSRSKAQQTEQQMLLFRVKNHSELNKLHEEVSRISSSFDGEQCMIEQIPGLSPVQHMLQPGSSSQCSLPFPQKESSIKQQAVVDSFQINQRRINQPRGFSYVQHDRLEESQQQSQSIMKFATIQERRSKKSVSQISNDFINENALQGMNSSPYAYASMLPSNDEQRQSKYQVQSSKFTGETSKQFQQHSPMDMPLYEVYQSFENIQQFSEYFPNHNADQALHNYHQFQDSFRSSKNKQTSIYIMKKCD